jgi:hypothetical protein
MRADRRPPARALFSGLAGVLARFRVCVADSGALAGRQWIYFLLRIAADAGLELRLTCFFTFRRALAAALNLRPVDRLLQNIGQWGRSGWSGSKGQACYQ